jgi:hypothetical protein
MMVSIWTCPSLVAANASAEPLPCARRTAHAHVSIIYLFQRALCCCAHCRVVILEKVQEAARQLGSILRLQRWARQHGGGMGVFLRLHHRMDLARVRAEAATAATVTMKHTLAYRANLVLCASVLGGAVSIVELSRARSAWSVHRGLHHTSCAP